MKVEDRFNDIKIEKLPEKTRNTLLKIEKVTKGFTIKIPKGEEYVNAVYNKIVNNKPALLLSTGIVKPLIYKNYEFLHNQKKLLEEKRDKLKRDLENIERDLVFINDDYKIVESVFKPHIIIKEVNNPSMGHVYIGEFHVLLEPNSQLCTICIGDCQDFKDINDPKLLEVAHKGAIDFIKSEFPDWF